MKVFDGNWQAFIARTLVFGVVVFGAVKLAVADPGGPASPNELTYSGVLRNLAGTGPLSGPVTLSFTLRRADGVSCPPVMVPTTATATGAFSAPVSTAGCPSGFFNGLVVTYDVTLVSPTGEAGPLTPDGGVAITPVPYARFADQAGVNNDCPSGYERDGGVLNAIVCRRALAGTSYDEVVKVGAGASAFWIDRYEASVWPQRDGGGVQLGVGSSPYPREFPPNGQWRTTVVTSSPVFALSRAGVLPSVSITWFQAVEACAASGKRLPTGSEWFRAAQGTQDPGSNDGLRDPRCNTTGGSTRLSGIGSMCVSGWGVWEMIGNVSEWTDEWYAGVGRTSFDVSPGMINGSETTGGMPAWSISDRTRAGWPTEGALYNDDRLYNISSAGNPGDGNFRFGTPSAAVRGGSYGEGSSAGVFTLNLNPMPTFTNPSVGFRCVVPR